MSTRAVDSKSKKQKKVPDLNLTQSGTQESSRTKKFKEPLTKERRPRKDDAEAVTSRKREKEAGNAFLTGTEPKLKTAKKKRTDVIGTDVPKVRRGYGSMPTASWNQKELAEVQRAIKEKKARPVESSQAGDIAGHSAQTLHVSTAPTRKPPAVPHRGSMPTLPIPARNSALEEGLNQTRQQPQRTAPPLPPPRSTRDPVKPANAEPISEQSKSATQSSDTSPSQSADPSPRKEEPQSLRTRATSMKPMKMPQALPNSPRTLKKLERQALDPQTREQPPSILPSVSSGTAPTQKVSGTNTLSFEDLFALMDDFESILSEEGDVTSDIAGNSGQQQVANKASGGPKTEKLAKAYFDKLIKTHWKELFKRNIHDPMQAVSNALPADMVMADVKKSPDALLNAMLNASIDDAKRIDFIANAIDLAATENPFGAGDTANVLHSLVVRTGNVWASKLARTHSGLSEDLAARAKVHAERADMFADLAKKLS